MPPTDAVVEGTQGSRGLVPTRGGHPAPVQDGDGLFVAHVPGNMVPSNMVSGSFVRRFFAIFEDLHETVTTHVDGLVDLADPAVAAPRMVASWTRCFALDDVVSNRPDMTLAQQRMLIGAVGPLINQRGTLSGLLRFLALALLRQDDIAKLADQADVGGSRAAPADLIGRHMIADEHGRLELRVDETTTIAVHDNGGVISREHPRRPTDDYPLVFVDLPHLGGFTRRDDLVELIRAELPAHVYVAVRLARPGAEPEQIYVGPAAAGKGTP